MLESFFTPSWYRVANLKPRLRGHANILRHHYRDELWYILEDHAKGRYYRFTPVAYQVIGLMDGNLTVQELWEKAIERFGDDAPSQGDIVRVLSQLHTADVLLSDVPPDTAELFRRYQKTTRTKWKMKLRSPLALRFPLLDPEKFLNYTIGIIRPFFSIYGAALWMAVVGTALVMVGLHWPELTEDVIDRVLSAENMLIMWFVFPIVKALHELGHGYAVKAWDGEVHEIGIMLLVLMPVPYVDASSSSALREKWRRVVVGSAGIMVELFVASLALFLWINLEQGFLRSISYNIIFLAGVSAVLFNGNPLLRYDGYYILSDLLEIPNLAQRGNNYLGYLFKRYLFRLKAAESPSTASGERFWLVFYTIASFLYRMFIYAAIILFISGKFFVIGILLGIWALFNMLIVPIFKRFSFVLTSPVLRNKRLFAVGISGILLSSILILLFIVPFPLWTRAEGIIWAPEEALVRAGSNGFITSVKAAPGLQIEKGDVVIECRDPLLAANVHVVKAQLKELEARYDAEIYMDRVQAKITEEEIIKIRADLARAQERLRDLAIRSPGNGVLILPGAKDLPDRYLQKGTLVGYVLDVNKPTVRVVVPQSDVDLVRHRSAAIEVRLAECLGEIIPAVLKREVPGALERLPSTILGVAGGGEIAIDPRDAEGVKTFEKLFQFDIEISKSIEHVNLGGRVYVLFDHGREPIASQWYRSLRRLFMRHFNV
jgi:putative peptide zinc metalloprotease protein